MLCALKDNPNMSAARFAFEANKVVKSTVHKTVEERSPSGAVSTSSRFIILHRCFTLQVLLYECLKLYKALCSNNHSNNHPSFSLLK